MSPIAKDMLHRLGNIVLAEAILLQATEVDVHSPKFWAYVVGAAIPAFRNSGGSKGGFGNVK